MQKLPAQRNTQFDKVPSHFSFVSFFGLRAHTHTSSYEEHIPRHNRTRQKRIPFSIRCRSVHTSAVWGLRGKGNLFFFIHLPGPNSRSHASTLHYRPCCHRSECKRQIHCDILVDVFSDSKFFDFLLCLYVRRRQSRHHRCLRRNENRRHCVRSHRPQ